ncbi:MAG: hypothetical protein IPM99_00675 [Rubrivivax sp.]|nr:hypothetical protein [Rubrivivax sp.]
MDVLSGSMPQLPAGTPFRATLPKGASTDPAVAVFSNPGMSLERPEIDDAKRVDPL